ncbi:hypothetical protein HMPREF0290_0110 [Corynebacterium efficiens YS-314]|nr:hypothetical protein HMPREF0290_0110 [Corynebacterium efficiens YS-314]
MACPGTVSTFLIMPDFVRKSCLAGPLQYCRPAVALRSAPGSVIMHLCHQPRD